MTAKDLVPLEESYATALGRAMFIFSRLEWQAVWCCEKINPGCIAPLSKRTAGGVSKALNSAIKAAPDAAKQSLQDAAIRFGELVEERNGLAHGKPCTAPGGEQRLSRHGTIWTHDLIDKAADEFAVFGQTLNTIFYEHLNEL